MKMNEEQMFWKNTLLDKVNTMEAAMNFLKVLFPKPPIDQTEQLVGHLPCSLPMEEMG
jgi:hypothetical protein